MDLENVKEMPFEVLYSVTNGLKFFSFSSYSQISFHMSNGAHGKMSKDRLCRENSIRGESVIHPLGLVTIYRYQKFQEGQLYRHSQSCDVNLVPVPKQVCIHFQPRRKHPCNRPGYVSRGGTGYHI